MTNRKYVLGAILGIFSGALLSFLVLYLTHSRKKVVIPPMGEERRVLNSVRVNLLRHDDPRKTCVARVGDTLRVVNAVAWDNGRQAAFGLDYSRNSEGAESRNACLENDLLSVTPEQYQQLTQHHSHPTRGGTGG